MLCVHWAGVCVSSLCGSSVTNRSSTVLAAVRWLFPVTSCSICISLFKSWPWHCCTNPALWGAVLCQRSPFASPVPRGTRDAEWWQVLCLLMLVGAIAFAAVLILIYSPTPALGFKYLQVEWAGFWSKINMLQVLWMWFIEFVLPPMLGGFKQKRAWIKVELVCILKKKAESSSGL